MGDRRKTLNNPRGANQGVNTRLLVVSGNVEDWIYVDNRHQRRARLVLCPRPLRSLNGCVRGGQYMVVGQSRTATTGRYPPPDSSNRTAIMPKTEQEHWAVDKGGGGRPVAHVRSVSCPVETVDGVRDQQFVSNVWHLGNRYFTSRPYFMNKGVFDLSTQHLYRLFLVPSTSMNPLNSSIASHQTPRQPFHCHSTTMAGVKNVAPLSGFQETDLDQDVQIETSPSGKWTQQSPSRIQRPLESPGYKLEPYLSEPHSGSHHISYDQDNMPNTRMLLKQACSPCQDIIVETPDDCDEVFWPTPLTQSSSKGAALR